MNRITFNTFTWLEWQLETIISQAGEFDYEGIECQEGADIHVRPGMTAAQTEPA